MSKLLGMKRDLEFEATSMGNRDATIARVYFSLDKDLDLEFTVDGTSKRDPVDADDPEVALLLAYGRAFEALGHKLLKRANGLTKHNDDIREYKEEQKKKKAPKAKKSNNSRKGKVASAK